MQGTDKGVVAEYNYGWQGRGSLKSLVEELERQKESAVDFIASTSLFDIHFRPIMTCDDCDGNGEITFRDNSGPPRHRDYSWTDECPTCKGSGDVVMVGDKVTPAQEAATNDG